MGGVRGLHGRLGEVRVHLDLVYRGDHRSLLQQGVQVPGHEVADADRPHPPVGEQGLQRAIRLLGEVEPRGERLVQDQQVDPVDAEFAGALVEGVQRLVVAVVTDPDLRLDEHVVAGQARVADGLADFAFVAVRGGGVDEPVAGRERRAHGLRGDVRRCLEHPEAERGHLDAVVQGQVHGHVVPPGLRRAQMRSAQQAESWGDEEFEGLTAGHGR